MIFETDRLIIRDLEFTDVSALAPIFADPKVREFSNNGIPFTWEQTEELVKLYILEAAQHEIGVCAIFRKQHHELIGYCGLEWHVIDGKIWPELVYCLDSAFWSQGLALEAASAVKKYAMETLKISPLFSFIKPGNTRSIRLAEKLGGRPEGTIRIYNIEKLVYSYQTT